MAASGQGRYETTHIIIKGFYADCGRSMRMVDGVRTAYADGGQMAMDRQRTDGSKWTTVEIGRLKSHSRTVTHKLRRARNTPSLVYDFNTWRLLVVNRLSFLR